MPHIVLLPGADYTHCRLAILAVGQHLLSYITCHRFLILRSEITSWLLHWLATIELASSKADFVTCKQQDFRKFVHPD